VAGPIVEARSISKTYDTGRVRVQALDPSRRRGADLGAHAVLPLQMVLMLPSMILVMLYRVDEYAGHAQASALARPVP
jgi:hypothetical protein